MKTYHLTNPPQIGGTDLFPLQKALKKIGLYGGAIDGIFGFSMGQACKRAKWRLGYPSRAVDHTGGQTLLDYLNGSKHLPPLYVLRRHLRGYGISKATLTRKAIINYALWGVANNSAIHYVQSRPMELRQHLPWYTDCSEFATTCYYQGKGPDPNGLGFDGDGYTGTMLQHGTTIALHDVQIADLVIWGLFPGHHVALFSDVTNKSDPKIISMGSERQPAEYALSLEIAAQGGRPMTFKRYIND